VDAEYSTSLDTLEFPVSPRPADASSAENREGKPLPQPFKHRGWAAYRDRIYRAIQQTEVTDSRSRRFAGCGAHVWVLMSRDDADVFKVVLGCCHDRFCLPCSRARAATIRANLCEHTEGMKLRFLTLTLAHTDQPLGAQLDRLFAAFKRLRSKALWKERVRGGVAFLEVKRSERTGRWHPHFHVLLDSDFLPQATISALWLDVTGDSRIVDIRLVRGQHDVANYVTKYVTKPIQAATVRDREGLIEAVKALSGRRMFIAFGTWRTWKLTQTADPSKWHLYAHESEIFERAHDGDPLAMAIVERITAFLYGDDDAEFRIPITEWLRGPPTQYVDRQMMLF
jgi:hypothetical protein